MTDNELSITFKHRILEDGRLVYWHSSGNIIHLNFVHPEQIDRTNGE